MTPVLAVPPAAAVVEIADLRAHLRITHSDDDYLLAGLLAAAVAHLDGWKGVLGRAILTQQWREEFETWGDLRLALPDVSAAVVTYLDAAGASFAAASSKLDRDVIGWFVTAAGPSAARVVVTYTCGLPAEQLPAVRLIIKMLVGHWYDNRNAVDGIAMAELPLAVQSLANPLRWSLM